jgi:TRAP-type C4-dicarboxylate transport system permease small subunit
MLKMTKKILDRCLETLIIVSMAVLTADVLWQVFTRLVLKNPSTWTEELATFLLIWVALLGSAVAMNRGAHLGVDYLTGKLPVKIRLYTEVFVFLCIALFSLCVMIIGGMDIVISTLKLGQISPSLEIKVGYVYLALPISGFFLVLYSAIGMIERIVGLYKHSYSEQITAQQQAENVEGTV